MPEAEGRGTLRSLAITGVLLTALLVAGLAPSGLPGALAKVLVFPHAGFVVPHTFPDRPATALAFPLAVALALLQWGLVATGLAWLTRRRSALIQTLASLVGILVVGTVVAGAALALGGQIRLD